MNKFHARGVLLLLLAGLMLASAGSSSDDTPKESHHSEAKTSQDEHQVETLVEEDVVTTDTSAPEPKKALSDPPLHLKVPEDYSQEYHQVEQEHEEVEDDIAAVDAKAGTATNDAIQGTKELDELAKAENELNTDEEKEDSVSEEGDSHTKKAKQAPSKKAPTKKEPAHSKPAKQASAEKAKAVPSAVRHKKASQQLTSASGSDYAMQLETPDWMDDMTKLKQEEESLTTVSPFHDEIDQLQKDVDLASLSALVHHLAQSFDKGCATGKQLVKELGMVHFQSLTGLSKMNCRRTPKQVQAEKAGKRIMPVSKSDFSIMVGNLKHLKHAVKHSHADQRTGAEQVAKAPLEVVSKGAHNENSQEELVPPRVGNSMAAGSKAPESHKEKKQQVVKLKPAPQPVAREVESAPLVVVSHGQEEQVPPRTVDGVALVVSESPTSLVEARDPPIEEPAHPSDHVHAGGTYTYEDRIYAGTSPGGEHGVIPDMVNSDVETHRQLPTVKNIIEEAEMKFHLDPNREDWPNALRSQSECFRRWSCGCFNKDCQLGHTWIDWEKYCRKAVSHADDCLEKEACADEYHKYQDDERKEKHHHNNYFVRGIFGGEVEKRTAKGELLRHHHDHDLTCGNDWKHEGDEIAEDGIIFDPSDVDADSRHA